MKILQKSIRRKPVSRNPTGPGALNPAYQTFYSSPQDSMERYVPAEHRVAYLLEHSEQLVRDARRTELGGQQRAVAPQSKRAEYLHIISDPTNAEPSQSARDSPSQPLESESNLKNQSPALAVAGEASPSSFPPTGSN